MYFLTLHFLFPLFNERAGDQEDGITLLSGFGHDASTSFCTGKLYSFIPSHFLSQADEPLDRASGRMADPLLPYLCEVANLREVTGRQRVAKVEFDRKATGLKSARLLRICKYSRITTSSLRTARGFN